MKKFLSAVVALVVSVSAQATTVMGSIKPVSLIAADLLEGVAEVDTLLPAGASPHDYALRPSDRRRLAESELLIWVGPETEPYLEKIIAASNIKALAWQSEESHEEHGKDEHDHDHEAMHPWLSPENAEHFAEDIAKEFAVIFPEKESKIYENLAKFQKSIEILNEEASAQLKDKRDVGFFVFHDAYQGLVKHYDLNQVGYFTIDPSRKPGAKHLSELRTQLEENQIRCVFVEPQFSPSVIDAITRGLNINEGQLDPLASDIAVEAGGYVKFIRSLLHEFDLCLTK